MSDKVVSLSKKRNKKEEKEVKKEVKQKTEKLEKETFYCSFCGRPNTKVIKMVRGPEVNICSECTMIAVQYLILEDKMPTGEAQKILDMFWKKV